MFGKSNSDKKIKDIEDEIKLLKANVKLKFQKLEWANKLIQLKDIQLKFDELKRDLEQKIKLLESEIQKIQKIQSGIIDDLPDIPWIREIVFNPKSEKLNYLQCTQKLKIWENIYSNIGFPSKHNIAEKYPFHLDEEYFQEVDMQQLGLIYLGQLGEGYNDARHSKFVMNFRDFKISAEEYQSIVSEIIFMGNEELTIHGYEENYIGETKKWEISFKLDAEEHKIEFNRGKYLDIDLVRNIVNSIREETEITKGYFWLHCDYGSYLLFLNNYQKKIIEKIFQPSKSLEEVA